MSRGKVDTAIVVAAGYGSRLQALATGKQPVIKPLYELEGKALIEWVVDAASEAGIHKFIVVVGFQAEQVQKALSRLWSNRTDLRIDFVYNPYYDLANGVSLFLGTQKVKRDFVLLMSDHIFQPQALAGLIQTQIGPDEAVLAVDKKISSVFDLDDATKVRVDWQTNRILDIGKGLTKYNGVDTGMFLIGSHVPQVMARLFETKRDFSISDVMKELIKEQKFYAYDIGDAIWQDIDTPQMLEHAAKLLRQMGW